MTRRERELRTTTAMITLWCRAKHDGGDSLCPECSTLLAYAEARLDHCVFAETKPTCARCPIHCYRAQEREQMRAMMRYAGPRMIWRHPWMALRHALDGLKPVPAVPTRGKK
jgi:predicted amidophosphoribosyltransferase